ncbi:hypothetical protein UFOVP1616_27 [uncultured Caudovirales phage]|uniref:Uncharacterized protein n=1 Tax=uncultured Caudovirales phage TaxID=2100421 RepID=A0A6J5SXE0_9CAUD|nr:hypothetical protein UFOVP1467_43 [uncultured Caudovirales phage]CAB4219646.1 hypothetical protein UFOVP1616_27 [uncultured Caudovirales phage]
MSPKSEKCPCPCSTPHVEGQPYRHEFKHDADGWISTDLDVAEPHSVHWCQRCTSSHMSCCNKHLFTEPCRNQMDRLPL